VTPITMAAQLAMASATPTTMEPTATTMEPTAMKTSGEATMEAAGDT
jgi:hypothetical protein